MGNPATTGLYQFEDKFVIPVIYSGSVASMIITDIVSHEYFNYNNFDFSWKPLTVFEDDIFLYAKDRTMAKGLKLAKLNDQFSFDWEKEIATLGSSNFPTSSLMVQEKIYNSFTFQDNGIKKIGINQSDLNGNSIWTKYFESDIGYSYLWTMLPTYDRNLLFSYTIRHTNETSSNPAVMKIDSLGNQIWQSNTIDDIDGGAAPIWLAQLSDSSIVQSYRVDRINDVEYIINNWHFLPMRLSWLDKNGQLIQQKMLHSPKNSEIEVFGLKAGKGDYFFLHGSYNDIEGSHRGLITKFSNIGDTLWTHSYEHPDYSYNDIAHRVYDIIEQDNGDIVALGEITPVGEQGKIWLFRVNANGCFSSAPCETIVSSTIESKPLLNPQNLSLFPNPTIDELTIALTTSSIANIEILDVNGAVLFNKSMDAKDYALNVQGWPSGMYLVKVVDREGKQYLQKFVKQ